jgi:hypothetical protein
MAGLPFGLVIETAVALLLALTIGYCIVLNGRLKRLHADRDTLRAMVTDLVTATNMANTAIKELKQTAVEADLTLTARLEEAERFGGELANHVNAGAALMERIVKITAAVRETPRPVAIEPEPATKAQSALRTLSQRSRVRSDAA